MWRALSLLVCAQLLLVIGVALVGHHSPPLDVTEMHTWAFAPQLGYFKHPPLPAWGVAASEALFGRTQLALFVPAGLSIVLATLAVWPLARRLVGARLALVALFVQSTVAYYTVYAPDYNHNVAQMPFWALTVSAAWCALRDGRARWWLAFGAALGVTALGKYSAIFLLPGLVALLLWEPAARRHVTPRNLLIAGVGVAITFGPHLAWLVTHDFAPLRYMAERGDSLSASASWGERFGSYVIAQLLANLAPLAVWLLLRGRAPTAQVGLMASATSASGTDPRVCPLAGTAATRASGTDPRDFPLAGTAATSASGTDPRVCPLAGTAATRASGTDPRVCPLAGTAGLPGAMPVVGAIEGEHAYGLVLDRFDRRFVLALGLGPFAATLAVGLAGAYLHPMWASAMFPLSGLLVVQALGARAQRLATRRWLLAWGALMVVYGAAYAVKNTPLWPALTHRYARAAYPGPELARQLDAMWHREVPDRPLRTIVGTPWEAGVASLFSADRTAVLIDADFAHAPWIAPDEIARCGAIATWDPLTGFEAVLRARFPAVKVLPMLQVDPDRAATYYRKGVAAAVIAPRAGSPAANCPPRA